MMNKLKFSLRIQLITIALCLVTTSSVLGLSAYLTDVKTYESKLRTATGAELGFSIIGNEYNGYIVTPGSSVSLKASAKVTKGIPLYIFIKVDIPAIFSLTDFNSKDWHPIEEDSNIYYYGTEDEVISTEGNSQFECSIMDIIMLPEEAEADESYNLNITGYAIQADNLPQNLSPKGIYELTRKS